MTTENNVAAQAGDEPMRAAPVRRTENGFVVHHRLEELVRTYGTLHVRAQKRRDVMAEIYEIAAAQVSPRATADVKRDAARYRWLTETNGLRFSPSGSTAIRDLGEMNEQIDAAIATTKPGA